MGGPSIGKNAAFRPGLEPQMTTLSEIYNTRILELAAAIPRGARLATPDATATAHSKLCGSTITVDIAVDGDRITDFGQVVKACLLGQSAASVVGREIVGTTFRDLREVARGMRAMLTEGGPPPTGRFADLAVLQPVKDYRARHASTLLIFEALEKAIGEVEARRTSGGKRAAVGE
jgi:NifU-like protein involved in Fe-S cluster formation